MADFLVAVTKTLQYEGGLVNNPGDPGGITNFGISVKSHPELTAAGIANMTRSQAIGIYREAYWPGLYGEIRDQALANILFDFGVTSGVATAVKILQAALFSPNLLGSGKFDFLHTQVTGWTEAGEFGNHTLYNLNQAVPRRMRVEFATARMQFYVSLGYPQFLHSWFARSIDALLD